MIKKHFLVGIFCVTRYGYLVCAKNNSGAPGPPQHLHPVLASFFSPNFPFYTRIPVDLIYSSDVCGLPQYIPDTTQWSVQQSQRNPHSGIHGRMVQKGYHDFSSTQSRTCGATNYNSPGGGQQSSDSAYDNWPLTGASFPWKMYMAVLLFGRATLYR